VSLGAMGVGYAAWGEGLKIGMNITTGNFNPAHKVSKTNLDLDDSKELSMYVEDENTLMITGKIYPTFNSDFPIVIENQGTIPAKLTEMKVIDDGEISTLQNKTISNYRFATMSNFSMYKNEIYTDTAIDPNKEDKPFDLNISAADIETKSKDKLLSH